jgi:hypothetical protein
LRKRSSGGHAKVWLEGKKLIGGYALTRIGGGKRERWLLVKVDDEAADRRRKPVSAVSPNPSSAGARSRRSPRTNERPARAVAC